MFWIIFIHKFLFIYHQSKTGKYDALSLENTIFQTLNCALKSSCLLEKNWLSFSSKHSNSNFAHHFDFYCLLFYKNYQFIVDEYRCKLSNYSKKSSQWINSRWPNLSWNVYYISVWNKSNFHINSHRQELIQHNSLYNNHA